MARHHRLPGYALYALLAPNRPTRELQAARQPHPPTHDADRPLAVRPVLIAGMRGALVACLPGPDAAAGATRQA